jgi:hypothetical protein
VGCYTPIPPPPPTSRVRNNLCKDDIGLFSNSSMSNSDFCRFFYLSFIKKNQVIKNFFYKLWISTAALQFTKLVYLLTENHLCVQQLLVHIEIARCTGLFSRAASVYLLEFAKYCTLCKSREKGRMQNLPANHFNEQLGGNVLLLHMSRFVTKH